MYPPTIGERFVLWYNKLWGGIVIDTSPVLKIEEGEIHTMYSIYEIEAIWYLKGKKKHLPLKSALKDFKITDDEPDFTKLFKK